MIILFFIPIFIIFAFLILAAFLDLMFAIFPKSKGGLTALANVFNFHDTTLLSTLPQDTEQ